MCQCCHVNIIWGAPGERSDPGVDNYVKMIWQCDDVRGKNVTRVTPACAACHNCHMSHELRSHKIRQCLSSSELLPSSDLSSPSSLRSLLWFWTSLLLLFSGPSPPSSLSQARWCSLQYRPSSLRAKKSPAVSFFPQATHTKHCRVADNFISSRYTLF